MNIKETLSNSTWGVKYRPKTLQEMILPANLRKRAAGFIASGNIPNMTLVGAPGMGKTTLARVLAHSLEMNYKEINASMDRNIDTMRNDVLSFASTCSLNGKKKILCLDEADSLNNLAQLSLRNLVETYDKNCTFIFTCNNEDQIIDALKSRAKVTTFTIPKNEKLDILDQLYTRIESILKEEKIVFQQEIIETIIIKNFPDFRKILNDVGDLAPSGLLNDLNLLSQYRVELPDEIFSYLKAKNFSKMQKWVVENLNTTPETIFRLIYDNLKKYISKDSIPVLVMITAKYMDMAIRSKDQEINLVAFFVELMEQCEFV